MKLPTTPSHLKFWLFKVFLVTLATNLALGMFSSKTLADEWTDGRNGITIEEVFVKSANKGQNTTVGFTVTNLGPKPVTLTGIQANFAGSAKLVRNHGDGTTSDLTNLTILRTETIDFIGGNQNGLFMDLKSDLVPNTNIEFEFIFSTFSTTATAHVHE